MTFDPEVTMAPEIGLAVAASRTTPENSEAEAKEAKASRHPPIRSRIFRTNGVVHCGRCDSQASIAGREQVSISGESGSFKAAPGFRILHESVPDETGSQILRH